MTSAVTDARPARRAVSAAQAVAAAPLVLAFLAALLFVGAWAIGWHPFWPVPELTLSEAVVTRDSAEVVRLIEQEGADANRAWRVRASLADGRERLITPLEAAVLTRRPEMIRLLLRHGAAAPDSVARASLICQAETTADGEVVEILLATGDGSDPRPGCAR